MATILYDNDSPHLSYNPLRGTADDSIYLGGSVTEGLVESNLTGLSVNFSGKYHVKPILLIYHLPRVNVGTSITLFGSIPETRPVIVTIDGTLQPGIQFVANKRETIYAIYQSPNLSGTAHQLTITGTTSALPSNESNLVIVDYATVTVGQNTPLSEERLIVDEGDPSVVFKGNWARNTSSLVGQGRTCRAYADATHQTSSIGSAATFRFNGVYTYSSKLDLATPLLTPTRVVGTSVSVFGVIGGSNEPFLLKVDYTMDGESSPQEYSSGNLTNFQWYQKDGLFPTDHTLKMTVREAKNAAFILDYIIYTPSFNSLAEKGSPSIQQPSSSQSQATNKAIGPQISNTLPPNHPGISHATLLGIVIGPILFGVIVGIILLVMRRKKLIFWSSTQRPNTVDPFRLHQTQTQGPSQLRVYHKSSNVNVQNALESPIPDHDLPLIGMSTTSNGVMQTLALGIYRCSRWWARLWQCTEPGAVEAFPHDWNPSSSHRPMVQQKPTLPVWHVSQQRASRQSDTDSTNETIVVDPQVQELQEMVIALQQEIEETRQDRSGAQNGALMREMVATRSESSNKRGLQESGDHGSVAMSTTVV